MTLTPREVSMHFFHKLPLAHCGLSTVLKTRKNIRSFYLLNLHAETKQQVNACMQETEGRHIWIYTRMAQYRTTIHDSHPNIRLMPVCGNIWGISTRFAFTPRMEAVRRRLPKRYHTTLD